MSEITTQTEPADLPAQIVQGLLENVPVAILLTVALLSNAAMATYANWASARLRKIKYRRKWTLDQELEAQRVASEIRIMLGADRVVFSYFHNNEVALSGLHFKKLTAYVEAKDPWTNSVLPDVRGIPVTMLLGQILDLIRLQGGWRVTSREDLTEGGCLRHLHKTGVITQFERIIEQEKVPLILVTVHYFTHQSQPQQPDLDRVNVILEQLPGLQHD